MDLTTGWVRQLRLLLRDLDLGDSVGPATQRLVESLDDAVTSFCGLELSSWSSGTLVRLTAFNPQPTSPPVTSLRWWITSPGSSEPDRLVIYAGRPGALVDLAADLQYLALGPAPAPGSGVVLDQDLPPRTTVSGVTGLSGLGVVSRVEGILLEEGAELADVGAELRRRATAAGLDPQTYARRLLRQLSAAGDGVAD